MARPKSNNSKSKYLKVRLTKEEYEKLKNEAEEYNLTVSDFVRRRIEKTKIVVVCQANEELFKQVHRVGVNINQMNRFLNMHKDSFALSEGNFEKIKEALIEAAKSNQEVLNEIRL